jgi:hypothetical protein
MSFKNDKNEKVNVKYFFLDPQKLKKINAKTEFLLL